MTKGRDKKTGQFAEGNRFWEARSSAGPKPKFKTAAALRKAVLEYFEWNEQNPLKEAKAFSYEGRITIAELPRMRAMTIRGLCIFLDISYQTWCDWRESRPDLSDVQREAEEIIYSQKFTGAAADLLNANIIARDLGLADKSELKASVQHGVALLPAGEDPEGWEAKVTGGG